MNPRFLRKVVAGALAVLVAGGVALAPLACTGAALGVGIATVGVSLLFLGASPGYFLGDPDKTNVSRTLEPDIHIGTTGGDESTVERLIFLGGELKSPVVIEGAATTASNSTQTLKMSLLLRRADSDGEIELDTVNVTVSPGAAPTSIFEKLEFARVPENLSYAGDIAVVRFESPSNADLTFLTQNAVVDAKVRRTKHVELSLLSLSPSGPFATLVEDATSFRTQGQSTTVPAAQTVTAEYRLLATAGGLYDIAGSDNQTSKPDVITYVYEGTPRFSLLASTNNSPTVFDLELQELDLQGSPIGPVLARAGPLRAEPQRRRIEGSFDLLVPQPFWEAGSTSSNPQAHTLGLRISNRGTADLTLGFDPNGIETSRIELPSPEVLVTLHAIPREASQPRPAR
jgi:hypothetical protein